MGAGGGGRGAAGGYVAFRDIQQMGAVTHIACPLHLPTFRRSPPPHRASPCAPPRCLSLLPHLAPFCSYSRLAPALCFPRAASSPALLPCAPISPDFPVLRQALSALLYRPPSPPYPSSAPPLPLLAGAPPVRLYTLCRATRRPRILLLRAFVAAAPLPPLLPQMRLPPTARRLPRAPRPDAPTSRPPPLEGKRCTSIHHHTGFQRVASKLRWLKRSTRLWKERKCSPGPTRAPSDAPRGHIFRERESAA